jgi:hypothetical protein
MSSPTDAGTRRRERLPTTFDGRSVAQLGLRDQESLAQHVRPDVRQLPTAWHVGNSPPFPSEHS